MQTQMRYGAALLASLALPVLAGCRVERHNGTDKSVSIDTPLGGLHVRTDPDAVLAKVGLPAYPGAQPVVESAEHKHSADVNLSFGSFKLQVLATALQTRDRPPEVEAFYRKALARYSDVIACRNEQPIGMPTHTGMGLSCTDEKHTKTGGITQEDRADDLELKAGSSSRQHIVVLKRTDDVTRIELISLELPHGDGDS